MSIVWSREPRPTHPSAASSPSEATVVVFDTSWPVLVFVGVAGMLIGSLLVVVAFGVPPVPPTPMSPLPAAIQWSAANKILRISSAGQRDWWVCLPDTDRMERCGLIAEWVDRTQVPAVFRGQ